MICAVRFGKLKVLKTSSAIRIMRGVTMKLAMCHLMTWSKENLKYTYSEKESDKDGLRLLATAHLMSDIIKVCSEDQLFGAKGSYSCRTCR